MEQKGYELIEKLAEKLGTTAEYLWSILLKQAKVQMISEIIFIIIVIIFGIILWRTHKWLSTKKKWDGDYEEAGYSYHKDASGPMVIGAMIFCILFLTALFSIFTIVNCALNPEYWALKKILEVIK